MGNFNPIFKSGHGKVIWILIEMAFCCLGRIGVSYWIFIIMCLNVAQVVERCINDMATYLSFYVPVQIIMYVCTLQTEDKYDT